MTDRLTTLMHDEVAGLELPAPPTARIIAAGRAMRRRRTTSLVAGAVAVVLAAGAVTVASLRGSDRDSVLPADRTAYLEQGAWAIGDEVHVGNHVVDVPGASTLAYSSVGAVVGTAGGDFVLVTAAGDAEPLELDIADGGLGGPTIATDPLTPHLAYIRAVDGGTGELVVRDLGSHEDTATGVPASSAGEVPQLWGDVLFWSPREAGQFINWRTGAELSYPDGPWTLHSVGDGAVLGFSGETESWVVTSRADGSTLLSVPAPGATPRSTATLSLDGRYLAVADRTPEFSVYDVTTQRRVATFRDRVLSGYSWTPDGHLVGKAQPQAPAEVETCDPATGACTRTGIELTGPITLVRPPTGIVTAG